MRVAAVVAVALVPTLAYGDPVRIATAALEPPGMTPPREDRDAPPDQRLQIPTTLAKRSAIVGASRGIAMGTALTVPAGTFELSFRTLAPFVGGAGIHAGITPTTELWVEAGAVMTFDDGNRPEIVGAGAKQVLARGGSWQIAATGSVRHVQTDGNDDGQLATVGGIATMCGDGCRVMVSTGVTLVFVEDEETMPMVTLGASVGNDKTRLFGEVLTLADRDERLTAMILGVRFGSRNVAFDIGFLKAPSEDSVTLPLLSLLVRS